MWFGKWHEEFSKFSPEHLKLKICTLMSCFWRKYKMFELKKYRGVMFDSTEYWRKIWRKTNLCFQKWHEEFSKFSPEHVRRIFDEFWPKQSKISKICTLMDCFWPKQPWKLGKKCVGNFILTFAVTKVRYDSFTSAKIFVKNLLILVVYQRCNDADK